MTRIIKTFISTEQDHKGEWYGCLKCGPWLTKEEADIAAIAIHDDFVLSRAMNGVEPIPPGENVVELIKKE